MKSGAVDAFGLYHIAPKRVATNGAPTGPAAALNMNPPEPQPKPVLSKDQPRPAVAAGLAERLLATDNLVKEYSQRKVVNGISVFVNPGEVVGLLGPNGAGKTTTFNIVVGVVKPDEGRVLLQGRDITRLPMHRRAGWASVT